jgi:hypothetical protein
MCNFLSGIGFLDGSIKTSDATDSHEHLILAFGLKESNNLSKNGWVRFEYHPENNADMCDVTKYRLNIDQDIIPDWVTDEIKESWERKANQLVKGMILIDGEIPILLGGRWVLGGTVVVNSIVNSIIQTMLGNSQVNEMLGNSQVNTMWENSQVNTMLGNSQVNEMLGNSQVKTDKRNK